MGSLQLSFLGGFQAAMNQNPLIHFRSSKIQGLLIYLVLTPQQAHTREHLATLFWPDEPETVAKKNVRQSLYRLRQLLGQHHSESRPFILTTRTTVQFNLASDVTLDVANFLRLVNEGALATAVSLYHGDLLPGFSCQSQPFDDWLRQERERCHQLALNSLYRLASSSLDQADFQTARQFAQKQLALEPWREEAHCQLMHALAALGERTAALAQYETCRGVLAEELGVEPTAETAALARRIRADQIQRPLNQPAPSTSERQRLKIPFVGRQAEYQKLLNAYHRARQDGLQVVTVVGNAGMGKTRLTEQFVTWATTQGADVLVGRAYETGGGLSYQPLVHLLRQRIERENAPEDLLSDLWLAQLTRLLPELRDRYPDLPPPTQEENTARQHLFEAIARLGQALAGRRPLVLFIDDWHWADSASLEVLHYAAHRWAEEKVPILLLLTLRQEALTASPGLQGWLAQLKRTAAAVPIAIGALSPTETAQLIESLVIPKAEDGKRATADPAAPSSLSEFSHWLFTQTQGQPLFLTEALKTLVEEEVLRPGPGSSPELRSAEQISWQVDWSQFDAQQAESRLLVGVREIIQGWLTRLSPSAVALLAATAVLSQSATFDNLCRVGGLSDRETLSVLEMLLNRQLLLETEVGQMMTSDPVYTFSHQKVCEVVYVEAGTARRRLLHRRAFEHLRETAASASDLAHHALHAGFLTETIRYSLIAGNEAMSLFAHQVAVTHYQTIQQVVEQAAWPEAVSGADRQAFYIGLGRAYELTEAWDKAKVTYEAMITTAQTLGATAMECLGLNRLATVYNSGLFDPQHAFTLLAQAQRVAEQSGDARGRAETAWNLARTSLFVSEGDKALVYAQQALALARTLDHPQLLARCLQGLAFVYMHIRCWDQAERFGAEAQQRYKAAGNLIDAAGNQRMVGACQLMTGRLQAGLVTLQDALAFSQTIENLPAQVESAWFLALVHMELGNYGEAVRLAKQATEQAEKVALKTMVQIAQTVLAMVYRAIMALDAAKHILAGIFETAASGEFVPYPDRTLTELCAVYALAGEWKQAHACAQKAMKILEGSSLLPVSLVGWYETEAVLRGGNADLAKSEVERIAGLVGENRRYQLPLLRSRAVLAEWDGDGAQAIGHLEAALALAQEMGLPGEAWPILGELGRLFMEQGEEVKARQAYGEAKTIIHCLAETIDDEALRKGFLTAASIRTVLMKRESF